MLRILYAVAVVTLVGGSAVAAMGMDRDSRPERGVAISALVVTVR